MFANNVYTETLQSRYCSRYLIILSALSSTFALGRGDQTTFEWAQLIDAVALNFSEPGENPKKLANLRLKKQLSMRQLSAAEAD